MVIPGVIQKETGPVSFWVKLPGGQHHRCHQDQMRERSVTVPQDVVVELNVSISPSETSIPTKESTPEATDSSTIWVSDSQPTCADASTDSNTTRKVILNIIILL